MPSVPLDYGVIEVPAAAGMENLCNALTLQSQEGWECVGFQMAPKNVQKEPDGPVEKVVMFICLLKRPGRKILLADEGGYMPGMGGIN